MDRRTKPVLRAGAMAFAAATGLLALASTGQTPTGFVPAAFGGPLGLFEPPADAEMADVLAIGDSSDASALADLLKTVGPSPLPTGPALPGLAAPGTVVPSIPAAGPEVFPAAAAASAPATKQSMTLKPVLDSKGQVDCSAAVSCQTDPATNITTITYSDGVVAIVQKINDLTLVAYKTVGDVISGSIDALLPDSIAAMPAAAVPTKPAPPPTPVAPAPVVKAVVPSVPDVVVKPSPSPVSAGPVAPSAPAADPDLDLSVSDIRPQLTISTPPEDFDAPTGGPSGGAPKLPAGTLDTVRDAVGSVVDAVTGAVGKAIGPGAATKSPAEETGSAGTGSDGSGSSGANAN